MSLFSLILIATPILTLLWWAWAHWKLGTTVYSRLWRSLLAVFACTHLVGLVWFVAARRFGITAIPPRDLIAAVFLWFIVMLPIALSCIAGLVSLYGAMFAYRKIRERDPAAVPAISNESRRRFLTAAAIAAPPLLQTTGLVKGLSSLEDFRIRRVDIPFAGLPRELDGARLAHVTDTHTGRFVSPALLMKIAEATNALKADAIFFTGDLIDYSLDDLPDSVAAMRAMDAPGGVWMCEGNHDLFDGHAEFEKRTLAAGVNLLLNEQRGIRIRGVDVQLLGQRWGEPGVTRDVMLKEHGAKIAAMADPSRFSILLAHHPHAFDPARKAGIDLTLAGHTHGGQLNIWPGIGVASMSFDYVSGLYRRPGAAGKSAACMVSNGVGNWFPLRVNAPAEIVEITLRRA